jgi:hypothetical protein
MDNKTFLIAQAIILFLFKNFKITFLDTAKQKQKKTKNFRIISKISQNLSFFLLFWFENLKFFKFQRLAVVNICCIFERN